MFGHLFRRANESTERAGMRDEVDEGAGQRAVSLRGLTVRVFVCVCDLSCEHSDA